MKELIFNFIFGYATLALIVYNVISFLLLFRFKKSEIYEKEKNVTKTFIKSGNLCYLLFFLLNILSAYIG